MSSNEIAIKVEDLSKVYQIYKEPHDRLLQGLFGRGGKKFYDEFSALQGINFEVARGETLGIIGRNGSGKSTLLQIIAGTLNASSGDLRIAGKVAAILELGAGFNPEFTGIENIGLSASFYGLSGAILEQRLEAIIAFADIGEFIHRPVKMYSSGMYVRLAFAIIAHVDADILIIDEALSVGDIFFTQKCMRFLREFQEAGTLLFVSHDSGAILNFCDRAIWLEDGKIRMTGESKEVVKRYVATLNKNETIEISEPLVQASVDTPAIEVSWRDERIFSIDDSPLRNEIKVFEFDGSSAIRSKEPVVKILDAYFLAEDGARLSGVVGGKLIELVVTSEAVQKIDQVIVGWGVKDRLGQTLFGDNTYLTYADRDVNIKGGTIFSARFQFLMPVLPRGEYSIDVAIAKGTQDEHESLQWVYDAMVFNALTTSHALGLIGIPMKKIEINF
jgi:lipopolysaccharide transport system ATP-binding protein